MPYDYYYFELYRLPDGKRLNYLFDQEVPNWNRFLSPKISSQSTRFLSSKKYFSQKTLKHGIPGIRTIEVIKKGAQNYDAVLFVKRCFFLKPDSGNQSAGCFLLLYCSESDTYFLEEELSDLKISGRREISLYLKDKFSQKEYLLQDLLEDHESLDFLKAGSRLTTFRVVTQSKNGSIEVISALIEMAIDRHRDYYNVMKIDPMDGRIENRLVGSNLFKDKTRNINMNEEAKIPLWQNVVQIVSDAHKLCVDIKSVGWDVAISTNGVKIIEGNLGWGTKAHQWGLLDSTFQSVNPLLKIL